MDIYNNQCGFSIPPEHIPTPEDMKRYKDGDPLVINVLVEGLTKYIVDQVNLFLSNNTSAIPYSEDCLSEGLLMLQEFTTSQLGKEYTISKFMGHAKQASLNKIKKWLREETKTIKIPASTQRACDKRMDQRKLTEHLKQSNPEDVFDEVWFQDFFDNLSDINQQIARLKIQGNSNREIGRQLKMDHHTVKSHLDNMKEIYEGNTK